MLLQECPERQVSLTWDDLTELEPRLRILERELLASPPPTKARKWSAYEMAKRRLRPLVGRFCTSSSYLLTSPHAWEVATARVLEILERPRGRRGAV
jgi:hypothetical protein